MYTIYSKSRCELLLIKGLGIRVAAFATKDEAASYLESHQLIPKEHELLEATEDLKDEMARRYETPASAVQFMRIVSSPHG